MILEFTKEGVVDGSGVVAATCASCMAYFEES
jgi:hypothetical protein